MILLSYSDLRARGISFSTVHLWRLEKSGAFPKRVPIGRARHGWLESEINEWLANRVAARDTASEAA
jgi:prophage regulatory protein